MRNDSVYKDAAKVCALTFLLGIIEFFVFYAFLSFRKDILIGVVYGCAFVCANFFYLAYSVKKSLSKDAAGAQIQMSLSYNARLVLSAIMIIIAASTDTIHFWAAVIPFVFQRIAIYIVSFTKPRKKEGSENS